MEERRRSPRVEAAIAIHYEAIGSSARGTVPQTRTEISVGGVRVPLAQQLEPGTGLKLELILPDRAASIQATGEVVWSARFDNEGPYKTGLRFTEIDQVEQEKLSRFIHQSPGAERLSKTDRP